ncbi:MAG TPA: hypothetical protein VGO58_16370, partial [Chitinophagaceae bacterium]|nr:hypothetical protein [Chitinophagaceae bacterium]
MTPDPSILYDLYNEIRKDPQLIHPGVEEYYLLIRLLDSGYPISGFDQLAFTIETLWLKSQSQKPRFRSILEKRRTDLQSFLHYLIMTSGNTDPAVKEPVKTDPVADNKDPQPKTIPIDPPVVVAGPGKKIQPGEPDSEETGITPESEQTNFSVRAAEQGTQSNMIVEGEKQQARPLTDIPFTYTHDYFPVHNRHLRQAWRTLKDKCET